MSVNKINDNMGKKIVEALKIQNSKTSEFQDTESAVTVGVKEYDNELDLPEKDKSIEQASSKDSAYSSADNNTNISLDDAFNQSVARNLGENLFNYEYPGNVAVLFTLMNKLPAGVSKQTAALIIAQTMEALGITINSVLNEAEEVQNSLANKVRECQKNIIDYRNRISDLEGQVQQYQKQVVKLGDIMNLFSKTGN